MPCDARAGRSAPYAGSSGPLPAALRFSQTQCPTKSPTHGDVAAFVKSLWVLGVRSRGRRAYWSFLLRLLLLHRRKFTEAMSLAILGHHFRAVARSI
ncbi:MAG: DUF4070 domain-containing protein [Planctomycetota bacterium]